MPLARQILEKIREEMNPLFEGEIVFKTDRSFDGFDGSCREVEGLIQRIFPQTGFLRRFRAMNKPLICFGENTYGGESVFSQAYDKLMFETAKAHYHEFVRAIRTNDRFANCADDFNISFSSLGSRVCKGLQDLGDKLFFNEGEDFKISIATHFERDYRGLTIAPFAKRYTLKSETREILGSFTEVYYEPSSVPYKPVESNTETLLYYTESPELLDLFASTAGEIAKDHTENGRFPHKPKVEIKEGKTYDSS